MKQIFFILLSILFLTLFGACATPPLHQRIKAIKVGMTKSEVLAKLGSPHRTERHKGKDMWTYLFLPDQRHKAAKIYFKSSKVVSIHSSQMKKQNQQSKQGSKKNNHLDDNNSNELDNSDSKNSYRKYKQDQKKARQKKSENFKDL